MSKIVLFLDVDGVLNQYDRQARIRRTRTHGFHKAFNPFDKKVLRLARLVKKYNIDVYVFSAWTQENLQEFLPFSLKGDTNKYAETVLTVMKEYDKCILIDDELSSGLFGHERMVIPKGLITVQPNYDVGMVLQDFKKLEQILKG